MASCKLPDLNELQRKEARAAVSTLMELGLGGFRVDELEVALPVVEVTRLLFVVPGMLVVLVALVVLVVLAVRLVGSTTGRNIRCGEEDDRRLQVVRIPSRLQPEADASAAMPDVQTSSTTWRNIRYGGEGHRRLKVFRAADRLQPEPGASVAFGERMQIAEEKLESNDLWLKLGSGTFANKWVLAKDGNTWNCACLGQWKGHPGRIPDAAFEGQDFPSDGMYTEGYEGSAGICLVSASGDAFWREVNIEMLFRDIATATVFEKQWGGDKNFTDWVAYYAGNVVTFGHLRTATPKQLIVTVKHTSRWRQYLPGQCLGPDVEAVTADIGKAQAKECQWLVSMKQRWDLKWDEVEFVTAFSFLTKYCGWGTKDCLQAAVRKLAALSNGWARTGFKKRAYLLEAAVWCLDEAFERQPAKKQLPAKESDALRRMLMSLTRKERAEFPLGTPGKAMRRWVGWQDDTWARIAAECGWIKVLEDDRPDGNTPDSKGRTLAHWAAKEGQGEVLGLLYCSGTRRGAKDDKGRTPAYLAAVCGQLQALKRLSDWDRWVGKAHPGGLNITGSAKEIQRLLQERVSFLRGEDPVTTAEKGDTAVLRAWHCLGKDLDLAGESGAAPARAAVRRGRVGALRVLAELGLDLDTQDESGKSLAHDAAGSNQNEVLRLLADRCADLDLKDADGQAPAHLAAKVGHAGILKVLADSGANLNLKDLLGRAPAHLATEGGQVEALRLLKDSRADLNRTDKHRGAPVQVAAMLGHMEAFRLLADSGTNPNLTNMHGEALVHFAARGGHVEALKWLVDNSADLNPTDNYGVAPVHLAVKQGHAEALELLVNSGANLNVTKRAPQHSDREKVLKLLFEISGTPAHVAAAKGCTWALRLLADNGAGLSIKNQDGVAPIHLAAAKGHMEVLQLLADRRCDLNTRGSFGWTPAFFAAHFNQVEALRLLVNKGADLHLEDDWGREPREHATMRALALLIELRAG